MDAAELIKRATDTAHVGRTFGQPIERDDCLVIPVTWVVSAGGGGGGEGAGLEEAGGGTGGGCGFFSLAWPMGVYAVKDGKVRWVPAFDATRFAIAGLALLRRLPQRRSRHRKR